MPRANDQAGTTNDPASVGEVQIDVNTVNTKIVGDEDNGIRIRIRDEDFSLPEISAVRDQGTSADGEAATALLNEWWLESLDESSRESLGLMRGWVEAAHAVDRERQLEVHGLFAPGTAIVVERSNALRDRHVVRPALLRYL